MARQIDRNLALLALALVVLLAGLGMVAERNRAMAANASIPLAARTLAAAELASLRPWDASAKSEEAMLRADRLIAADKLREAQEVLYRAYLADLGNKPLRAKLREVNLKVIAIDSGKAHRQHGHEGPGGTLRPEDVER